MTYPLNPQTHRQSTCNTPPSDLMWPCVSGPYYPPRAPTIQINYHIRIPGSFDNGETSFQHISGLGDRGETVFLVAAKLNQGLRDGSRLLLLLLDRCENETPATCYGINKSSASWCSRSCSGCMFQGVSGVLSRAFAKQLDAMYIMVFCDRVEPENQRECCDGERVRTALLFKGEYQDRAGKIKSCNNIREVLIPARYVFSSWAFSSPIISSHGHPNGRNPFRILPNSGIYHALPEQGDRLRGYPMPTGGYTHDCKSIVEHSSVSQRQIAAACSGTQISMLTCDLEIQVLLNQ